MSIGLRGAVEWSVTIIRRPIASMPARRQSTGSWSSGAAGAVTGYNLMFPFYISGIEGMQLAQIVHSVVAVLFVAVMLAHIYIGTIGMEGAFEAMGAGTVDVNWAREHHSLGSKNRMPATVPTTRDRGPLRRRPSRPPLIQSVR